MSNSNHGRHFLTPGASRKRKEREAFDVIKASTSVTTTITSKEKPAASNNRLLAGYMAYEFLTKGTILGEKWDPARAKAAPIPTPITKAKPAATSAPARAPTPRAAAGQGKKHQSYAEVASLLKMDGAHIAGIVNPTQLAQWLQM